MSSDTLSQYNLTDVVMPQHVAIIMDGNGRWAKKRLWNRVRGHKQGAKTVDEITSFCRAVGVKYLTLYAFSTENWNRPQKEVDALMNLLEEFLRDKRETLLKNNIRLNVIGSIERLPDFVRNRAEDLMKETAHDYKMTLTLALSYGSREEIVSAVKKIAQRVAEGDLSANEIDDNLINSTLYTDGMPDPDLVIRTSGEQRISNFLLWQIAYAEFYFTPVLWPDFGEAEMAKALHSFGNRTRRFGKTDEQLKEEK